MEKKLFLLCMTLWATPGLKAQTDAQDEGVQLNEAVVRGARVISRTDGTLIYPSEEMLNSAMSGYSLLKMLPLPNVKVDDVNESIATANPLAGAMQVRINDVVASAADLRQLQPKEVEKVEFIDRPGVRYGDGVGIVINIITRKISKGYAIGASGTAVPKAGMARGNAYTRLNSGRHGLSLNYSGNYTQSDGMSIAEHTDYLMTDGTDYKVDRNTYAVTRRDTNHEVQARYSMMDTESTTFLATLATSVANNPRNSKETDVAYPDGRKTSETSCDTEKAVTPLADLYWKTRIGNRQTLVANATGTYTHTDYSYRFASDDATFGYRTLGKAWSFRSEALYENRLKPFTLSAGVRYSQKHIHNNYSGDATLVSQIQSNSTYAFTQIQGSLWKIGYMAGLGLSREHYRQGETTYNRLWLRPKLSISLPIAHSIKLNYTVASAPAPSKLQNMSGMAIMDNGMEYSVGNPELIMARRDDHTLTLSFQSPRLYTQLMAFYRHNAHPAMQHIYRTGDGRFAKTFLEGRRIDMLMLQGYAAYDIIPRHLHANLSAEMLHIRNDGRDYSHRLTSFNFDIGLTAWIADWTLMATVDNGFHFMENEYEGRNIYSTYLSVSYKIKRLSASIFCQNPFKRNGKAEEVINHNRLVRKLTTVRNRDTSSAIGIKLTWTLSKGRQPKGIERDTDKLKDTETGIAKSGK